MSDEGIVVEVEEEVTPRERGYKILPEEDRKRVVQQLQTEYAEGQSEVAERKIKWDKWRRQRQARSEFERKDYPFPNASNVSVPLTRINTQTLFGKLKGAFMSKDPMWTTKALRDSKEDYEVARVLTKYMNILAKSPSDLNVKQKGNTIFMEGGLLGFQWVKTIWSKVERSFMVREGDIDKEVTAKVHDGPDMVVCPPEDIIYKHTWGDINYVPYFFHDIHLPWHVLQQRANDDVYENVEELEKWSRDAGDRTEEERARRIDVELSNESVWDITEAYFYWEINGKLCYLIVTLHIPSGTILKEQYNTLGFLPFEPLVFIHEPYVLEGTGIGLACEHMQDEIDAIHNMRNDNMKIANMRMFVARRTGTIKPNEKMFPGKILFADNPKDDIVPFQLGEVYPSSSQAEGMTIMYSQKATGMNDPMSGFSDQTLGSRDTFRGQAMRLEQGHGILSSIMENMVEGFSNVAKKIFFILVQNRDRVIENERVRKRLTEEELMILEYALSIPYDEVPFRLSFEIRTTDVEQTFEAQRQNVLALTQLYAQYANQTMPLVMQLMGSEGQAMQQKAPDLYNHMLSIYIGSTKLIADVFRLFGEEDTEEYLPSTEKMEMVRDIMNKLNELAMQGGLNAAGQNQRGPGAGAQGAGIAGPGGSGEPGVPPAGPGGQGTL